MECSSQSPGTSHCSSERRASSGLHWPVRRRPTRERVRPSLAMGPASRRGVVVALALILLTVTVQHVVASGPAPRELNADVIPLEMQGWKATASRLEESAVRAVGVDEEVLKSYELPGTGRVHLYVGYPQSAPGEGVDRRIRREAAR